MPLSPAIATGINADGRLQLFVVGSLSTQVYTCSQVSPNGSWGPWTFLGGPRGIVELVVGTNADGRLELFALTAGNVLSNPQTAPNGNWAGWTSFETVAWQQMAVANNADGRLELFGLAGGDVYHTWQLTPNAGWSNGAPFGVVAWQQIAVAGNADGRLELFGLANGNVYSTWQTAPNDGWSPGVGFGTIGWQQLTVGGNLDGRLQLFGVGPNGDVYSTWQTAPNGGWSPGIAFGTVGWQKLVVGRNADGRLQLFGLGPNGDIYSTWQTVPGGGWSPGIAFGTVGWQQMTVASNADGRLELFGLSSGSAFHVWQVAPNANWSPGVPFSDPEPPPVIPGIAFQFGLCLDAFDTPTDSNFRQRMLDGFEKTLKRLATGRIAPLAQYAKPDSGCFDQSEHGGIFLNSEAPEVRAASLGLIDLFSKLPGPPSIFAFQVSAGALRRALAILWDSYRDAKGNVKVPNFRGSVSGYSLTLEPGLDQGVVRLSVDGSVDGVDFTAHFNDTMSIDGDAQLVKVIPRSGVDIAPWAIALDTLIIPFVANWILGEYVMPFLEAPPFPSVVPGVAGAIGGIAALVFVPKIYRRGKDKIVLQYQHVRVDPVFGIIAGGGLILRNRAPSVGLSGPTPWRLRPRPVNKPPVPDWSKILFYAETDDMRDPTFSWGTTGRLVIESVDASVLESNGVRWISKATLHARGAAGSGAAGTVSIVAMDADGLTQSASATVMWEEISNQ